MIPIELDDDVRNLESMLGTQCFSSGCCASDLTPYPRDHVPYRSYKTSEPIVESRVIGSDGKVRIVQPDIIVSE